MTSERVECPARFREAPTGATTLVAQACTRRSSTAARSVPVITVAIVSSSLGVIALIEVSLVAVAGSSLRPVCQVQVYQPHSAQ